MKGSISVTMGLSEDARFFEFFLDASAKAFAQDGATVMVRHLAVKRSPESVNSQKISRSFSGYHMRIVKIRLIKISVAPEDTSVGRVFQSPAPRRRL